MGLTDIAYLCDLSAFSKKFKVSYQDISYKGDLMWFVHGVALQLPI